MSTHDPWTLSALGTLAARATIVLGAAWIGARLAPRHSAATRHAFWVAGLATVLALPLLSGALPAWHLAVLPAEQPATVQAPSQQARFQGRSAGEPVAVAAREPIQATREDAMVAHGGPPPALAAPVASPSFSPSLRWAWGAWALIALAVVLRYVLGLITVRRLTRRATPVTDAAWRDEVDVAVAALGLDHAPEVLLSDEISVPFTCGFLRPSLVVPESAQEWTAERRRVVLLHELAHVARRDCLVQGLSHVACAAYWFHPLAWLAARRLRAERERACDDLVLQAGTQGAEYAQHLLDIARAATSGAPRLAGAALAMARPSELEGRLLAILDGRRDRSRTHRRVVWQVAVLAAVVALPSATVQLVARDAVTAGESQAVATSESGSPAAPAAAPQSSSETSTHEVTREVEREVAHHSANRVGQGIGAGVGSGIATGVAGGIAGGVVEGVVEGVAGGVAGGVATGMALHMAQSLAPRADDDGDQPATLPPAVLKGLTEALKDTDADVRRQALHALVRFRSPAAYDALTSALADSDPEVRQEAVFALGQLRDTRATQPLVGMLKDSSPEVRQQAAFGLGQLRAREAAPALAGVLHDGDADVRQQAIFALGQIGDPGSAPAIAGALSDQAADVRQQAAFALGQLGNASVVAALTGALKDKEPEVREQAAFALGQIGDAGALEALTAALKDANADVRQQAIFAISQIASGHHHRPRAEQPPQPAAAPVAPAPRQAPAPAQAPQATPPPQAR